MSRDRRWFEAAAVEQDDGTWRLEVWENRGPAGELGTTTCTDWASAEQAVRAYVVERVPELAEAEVHVFVYKRARL